MTIYNFQNRLNLILRFALKLKKEEIPKSDKKTLIRSYAMSLNINLTNKMIDEVLLNIS